MRTEYCFPPTVRVEFIFLEQLVQSDRRLLCALFSAGSPPRIPCSGHPGFLCFLTVLCSFLSLGLYNLFSPWNTRPKTFTTVSFFLSLVWRPLTLHPRLLFTLRSVALFSFPHIISHYLKIPQLFILLLVCCLFSLEGKLRESRESCHVWSLLYFLCPEKLRTFGKGVL